MGIAYLRAAFGGGLLLAGKSFLGVLKMRALLHVLRLQFRTPITHPVRFICCCLAGVTLSVVSAVSHAEGTVNPTYSTSAPPFIKYDGYVGLFDTPEAACQNWVAHQFDTISTTDLVYDHVGPSPSTRYPPEDFVSCYSRSPSGAIGWLAVMSIRRSCDGLYWVGYAITCPKNVCPANSTGAPEANPTSCTCDTGYAPDAAKTSCVPVVTCPIDPLPGLPKDDLCAQSIEAGRGADKNKACSSLTPEMQKQADCLAAKIHALGQSYTGPSATIRNAAYQKHLREVWDKSIEIKNTPLSDEEKLACAAVIADVNNHMDWHAIDSAPSKKGNEAPHVKGNAVDIPRDAASALMDRVSNTTFVTFTGCIFCIPIAITTIGDVQDYVNNATINPPACNLKWGGRFKPVDKVHFQLP